MGKKKRQIKHNPFMIYSLILISVALFYQNCSDVRISNGRVVSPSTASVNTPSSADAYDYKASDSSTMPGGGMEPGDWNVEGSYWFDNFIFGDPGFRSCQVFNMETQQVENKPLLVITGEEADVMVKDPVSGKEVQQHVKTFFELRNLLDFRFGELGNNGITAFRIFVPPDAPSNKVTLDFHVCCSPNLMPQGVVVSISKKLCDFREKSPSEKIYTRDYCTIGNTANGGLDIMTSLEALPSPSGTKPCTLEPGYYYYVNIINGHSDFTSNGFLNGVLSIRSN